jgi:hypothetical protein
MTRFELTAVLSFDVHHFRPNYKVRPILASVRLIMLSHLTRACPAIQDEYTLRAKLLQAIFSGAGFDLS